LGFVIKLYNYEKTQTIPEKDQWTFTRKALLAQMDVAMGGRAAEELFLGID
jgi:ATP-dependent metalloprotease